MQSTDALQFNCALKVFGEDEELSAAELEAATETEYEWNTRAWEGGVSHMVEPLGVYHAPNSEPPKSYILMRYAPLSFKQRTATVAPSKLLALLVLAISCACLFQGGWEASYPACSSQHRHHLPGLVWTSYIALIVHHVSPAL